MAEQTHDPTAKPGDDAVPRVELAPGPDERGKGKPGRDPFAPPVENDELELALEVAKPIRRPTQQTVAPDPTPRSLSAERSSTSGVFRIPQKGGTSGVHRLPERGASGMFRVADPAAAPQEFKAPREGASNLVLWAFAGLGVLAVIGSAVRFLRGSSPETAAVTAAAPGTPAVQAPAQPTVWNPVELGPNVVITVDVSPRSARLLLDGEPIVSNPVALTRGSKHTIGALADGFEGSLTTVTADRRKTVRIVLRKARR
jgi:hypothetical protein